MRDMPSTLSAQQIAMQSVAPFAPTDAVAALAVEQSAPIQPVNETVMVAATRAIPIAKVPQALPDVVTPAPAASDSVRPEPTLAQPSVAPFVPGAAPLPFAVVVRDDDTSSTQRSVPFVASAAATVSIPPVLTISSVATPLVVLEAAEVTAIPAVAQHSTQAGVVPSASHTAHAPQVSVDTTWQPLVAGKLHEPSVLPQVAPPAQLQSLQTSFDEQHVIPASIENADASIVPPNSANFAEESAPLAISTVVLPELLTGRVHSLTHEEPAVTLLHQTMPLSHAVETPAVVAASMPEQVTAAPAQTLPNTTDIDAIISAVAVSPQAPESEAPPATVAAVHERSPASDIRVTPPVVALSPAQLAAPITVEAAPTAAPADDAINMAGNASLASTAGMVAPATTAAPVAPRMKATASIRMSAPVISGSEMTVVASAAPMTTGVTADDSSLPGSQTIIEVQARAQEPIGMPRQGEHDAASVEHDMRTASSIDDLVNTPSRQAGQHQDDQRTISEAFLSSMAGPVSSSHTAAPAEVREPAALEPESIIRQVAVQVRRVATEMPREITVRLDPPMLGTLHVTVQERNGELVARIESPHQAVCQSLDQRLPELRQALEDAGIRVSNCQVSLNMQSGREGQPQWQLAQQGHRDWHPQPMVPGNPQTDDGVEHPAVLPSVEKMRLLDLFA
jgi:flagellar hook-length control protein FliK